MHDSTATIFARASGKGRAGVAVFRISGAAAHATLARLVGGEPPPPRHAARHTLRDPATGEAVDDALVLYFRGPHSYTGEDVVELHVHGSPAVERRLLAVLAAQPELRVAEPGEFTRRAFENGRLDLAQAEGLADLINAETESQRRLAQRALSGAVTETSRTWRERILQCLARVEAAVDFPEELTESNSFTEFVVPELTAVAELIATELRGSGAAERLRTGLEVAIIGPPNVGKSQLVNCLAGRELAISTAEPGTTRDIIEAHLEIAGLPVTVLDTAGLRDVEGTIEAAGIERAARRAELADLRVHLAAPDVPGSAKPAAELWREGDILAANKSDLGDPQPITNAMPISALTGAGVPELVAEIGHRLGWIEGAASPAAAVARRRQALERCAAELHHALTTIRESGPPEIIAEHLRQALHEIERFAGRVDVEDVLDIVFAEFCLGK